MEGKPLLHIHVAVLYFALYSRVLVSPQEEMSEVCLIARCT